MAEETRFLNGIFQHLFCPRRKGDITEGEGVAAGREIALHLHAELLDVNAHLAQHGNGDAVLFTERSEKEVLCSQVIILQALRFFAGVHDYFSSSFCELFKHHGWYPPPRI